MADEIHRIGFGFDTSGLNAGKKAFDDLGAAAQRAGPAIQGTQQAVNQAQIGAQKLGQTAQQAGQAVDKLTTAQQQAGKAVTDASNSISNGAKTATDAVTKLGGLAGPIQGVGQHITDLASRFGLPGAPGGLTGSAGGAMASLTRFAGALGPVGAALASVAGVTVAVVGAYGALNAALAGSQDKFAQWEGRIKNALGSTTAAKRSIEELIAVANKSGVSLDGTVETFTRLARQADALGATRSQLVQLTDTVTKLGIVSGATSGEVSSGLLQLSQSLASGRLNGDELRSIMENMPALAKAIADGLGVSVGQLRSMGAEGTLTADKVFKSLISQGSKINEEFEKMPGTVERSFQRMRDQASQFAAHLGERLNSSEAIQGFLKRIESAIKFADDLVKPSTNQQRLDELNAQIEKARSGLAAAEASTSNPGLAGGRPDLARSLAIRNGIEGPPESARANAELTRMMEERARLMEKMRKDNLDAVDAASRDESRPWEAAARRGLDLEREQNELAQKRRKITEDLLTLEKSRQAIQQGYTAQLPPGVTADQGVQKIRAQEAALREELRQTGTEYDKRSRQIADLQADATRYSTRALELIKDAREIAEQSTKQGVPTDQYRVLNAMLAEQATKLSVSSRAFTDQAHAIGIQTEMIGKSSKEVRVLEADLEFLETREKNFGNIQLSPAMLKALNEHIDGWRRAKEAQDRLTAAQETDALRNHFDRVAEQLRTVKDGAYATARALNELEAAEADRTKGNGAGDRSRARFDANQALAGEQAIEEARQRRIQLAIRADTVGDPAERLRREREYAIEQEQRKVSPAFGDLIAGAQRADNSTADRTAARERLTDLREQVSMAEQMLSIQGQTREQYAVTLSVLQAQASIRKELPEIEESERNAILETVAALAKKQFEIDEQKRLVEQIRGIWQNAANGIQRAFSSAFEMLLEQGAFTRQKFEQLFAGLGRKIAAEIMTATFITPFVQRIQKQIDEVISTGSGSPGTGGRSVIGGGGNGANAFGMLAKALTNPQMLANIGEYIPTNIGAGLYASAASVSSAYAAIPADAVFTGFAKGGGVVGGKSVLVGENGPELFTPQSSGFVTPNHALRDVGLDRWSGPRRAMGGYLAAGETALVGENGPEGFTSGKASGGRRGGAPVTVNMNITTPDVGGFRASQSQVAADLARGIRQAQSRNA